MEIISREAAIAEGLHRFYTGEPCRNGHDSERFVSSRGCIACHNEYRRKKEADQRRRRVKRVPVHKNRHTGNGLKIEKNREERNGVKRPSIGGKCRAVWDAMDTLVANGETPSVKLMRAIAEIAGWNVNNTVAELYTWRRFHGMPGRSAA